MAKRHDVDNQDVGRGRVYARKPRPSLRGVAAKLGVSHTAVAKALRGDPSISQALRERIVHVARQEGYVVSDVTRGLTTGQTGLVGVVLPSISHGFMAPLLQGLVDALQAQGRVPLTLCSQLDLDREERAIQALAAKRVDALVIAPAREDRRPDHFIRLLESHTPIIALDSPLPHLDAPLVASDDRRGARLAVDHLLKLGHRHIAFLGGGIDSPDADRRRELAYVERMTRAGCEPVTLFASDRLTPMGQVVPMVRRFLASPTGRRTTAFFCASDELAQGVMRAADALGRVVGRDLALIGFGGPSDGQDGSVGRLSSVCQFPQRWGVRVVDVLEQMMRGRPVPPQTLIPTKLLLRDSACPPGVG